MGIVHLAVGFLKAFFAGRTAAAAGNLASRHQLAVLRRAPDETASSSLQPDAGSTRRSSQDSAGVWLFLGVSTWISPGGRRHCIGRARNSPLKLPDVTSGMDNAGNAW